MKEKKRVIIDTDRLQIRSAQPEDSRLLHTLWTDPRVMANVGYPQGLRINREEIEKGINEQDLTQPFGRYLMVDIKGTILSIGECKMYLPDEEGISRTDIKLVPDQWGNKYGVEVKQALLDYLFDHTDCRAVEGTPNVANVASIKMQEAVGAVRVGEATFDFPESMSAHTAPVHHYIYHVFRTEWQRCQKS